MLVNPLKYSMNGWGIADVYVDVLSDKHFNISLLLFSTSLLGLVQNGRHQ